MKRFLTILREQLRGRSLVDVLSLAKRSLFCNEPIWVYELDGSMPDACDSSATDSIRVRKGAIEELDRERLPLDPLPWEFQCHTYDGVRDFYLAGAHADEIRHISWVYHHGDPNRFLALRAGQAEIKYCLTLPAFRGTGIYPRVLREIGRELRAAGIERVFICVARDNRASIRGIEKAGFARIGAIRLVKIMGIQVSPRLRP